MGSKKKKRPDPASFELPHLGVDSHAHLDFEGLAEDLEAVVQRATDCGICKIGQVFLGPEAYAENSSLFTPYGDLFFFLLGIHPHEAKSCSSSALEKMEQAFKGDSKIKAVGEIGLDFHYDLSPREKQIQAFQEQLSLAKEIDLPVVIHSREADEKTLELLLDRGFKDRRVLWHCFGRDADFARKILHSGWMLSVPGTVTFPKSVSLQEAVKVIPEQRLLLETDCPFLSPAPYRGKQNEPSLLAFTAEAVAKLKEMPLNELWAKSGENALKFFC